jgi:hypothetical protein
VEAQYPIVGLDGKDEGDIVSGEKAMARQSNHTTSLTIEGSGKSWFGYTSSRETMRTWPRPITSTREIPQAFQSSGIFDSEVFPYAVYIPENIVLINAQVIKTRQKIVSLLPDRIVFIAVTRGGLETVEHRLSEIELLRTENVLLSAVLSLRSPAGVSRVGYNGAGDLYFEPIIRAVREGFNRSSWAASASEPGLERLAEMIQAKAGPDIGLKFVNFAARSLFPGQIVESAVFKDSAGISGPDKGIFFRRLKFTSPILLMSTRNEIISIEEPIKLRAKKTKEFGGISTFVPREKIAGVSVKKGKPVKTVIRLISGSTLQFIMPDSDGLETFRS